MSTRSKVYPRELRERAVRLVGEVRAEHSSEWAAIESVASNLGVGSAQTVHNWVRKAQVDAGSRPGTTSEESAELRKLRSENRELRRANEILKAASAFFAAALCATRRLIDRGGVRDLSRWAVAAAW
jgi:transposase